MLTDFRYKDFNPSEEVEREAEEILVNIKKCVPIGTTVVGSMEFDGAFYTCSFDAYLKRGSFYGEATDRDPLQALQDAEEMILKKVLKTKETRFFTRADRFTNETHDSSEYVN